MKELIEQLIRERNANRKECKYLVIGKEQFNRLWLEINYLINRLEDTTKIHNDMILMGLKVIIVNSDIIEVVGDNEI
jgi:hypothetical protein